MITPSPPFPGAPASSSFRDHLFPIDHPRLAGLSELDAAAYADSTHGHPVAGPVVAQWRDLFDRWPAR